LSVGASDLAIFGQGGGEFGASPQPQPTPNTHLVHIGYNMYEDGPPQGWGVVGREPGLTKYSLRGSFRERCTCVLAYMCNMGLRPHKHTIAPKRTHGRVRLVELVKPVKEVVGQTLTKWSNFDPKNQMLRII
jgi:hypothetical protein